MAGPLWIAQELGLGSGLRIIQGDEFIVLKAKSQIRAVIERNFVGPHQCKEVGGASPFRRVSK
jgi:hypothetical protein